MMDDYNGKKLICVTNRHLCADDFIDRLRRIASAGAESAKADGPCLAGVMLREKDLPPDEYTALAMEVKAICDGYGIRFIAHSHPEAAEKTGAGALHLPLGMLEDRASDLDPGIIVGASCHSVEDALLAEKLGCGYITLGHIFETDCKKGLAPRGLDLLRETASKVTHPSPKTCSRRDTAA